jgi:uncharacterized protein YbbC (DUF1343 family)
MFETGLDVFLKQDYKKYRGIRLGVLCNQASVDKNLIHISQAILQKKLDLQVACFFGPQHGIRGEKQDNMIESEDFIDPVSQLPVISLYGKSREPSDDAVEKIDAFVIDLQDIGTRIYTFMYTMANCMRAAKKLGKKVIVLDRPNPINGVSTEGNVLESGFTSFVGQFPICVRHGMTIGELALLFNEAFGIGCDLEVIHMRGWQRAFFADDLKRDWIPPSPNIPNLLSALVFPGCVLFEGTNLSEGRGTTRPFEWIGAPFINPDKLAAEMNGVKLPGVYFRPIYFQPTYQKWRDEVCGGVHLHVTNRRRFNSFQAGVRLLGKIAEMYPEAFRWKNPPYEYEHDRMPIDLIAGTSKLREAVEQRKGTKDFEMRAEEQVREFRKLRAHYLIYQ